MATISPPASIKRITKPRNPEYRLTVSIPVLRRYCRCFESVAIFLYGGLELAIKRPKTRELRAEWLHQFCARTIRAMGITVRVEGRFPERGALISNHMGYLDIMTYAAVLTHVQADKDTANVMANGVPNVFSVTNNLRVEK